MRYFYYEGGDFQEMERDPTVGAETELPVEGNQEKEK